MFKERHRLCEAAGCLRFLALEFEKVQALEPGWRDTMPACELLHVIVKCHEQRVVRLSGNANQFIPRAACDGILEWNKGMAMLDEHKADRGRHTLI